MVCIETSWKDMFEFCDEDGDGLLNRDEFGIALRALGILISEKDLDKIAAYRGNTLNIDFFRKIASEKFVDREKLKEDIVAAFRALDGCVDDKIDPNYLSRSLATLGEKLPKQQIDKILSQCFKDLNGQVDINEIINALLC